MYIKIAQFLRNSKKGGRLSHLIDGSNHHQNNFDFIRFFAANLVIISHSFPISYGNNLNEPIFRVTDEITLGGIGVYIFFIVSGFLITRSCERSDSIYNFFRNRALRIYPALIVAVLITAFIMGPILSKLSLLEYFSRTETYRYLVSASIFKIYYGLPGVFINNPNRSVVNGSLWSLRYEVFCYIFVAALGFLKLLNKHVVLTCVTVATIIAALIKYLWPNQTGLLYIFSHTCYFITFFGCGMLIYLFRDHIILNTKLFFISLSLLVIVIVFSYYPVLLAITGTYCIIFIAYQKIGTLANFSRSGDFSYGIYIYAFPIQQIYSFLLSDNREWWINCILSIPTILIFAVFSWHLVEKKALSRKSKY
ncbi:MAG: acyltransferase [Spirochaetes bacterium]|nr:acyltransferase [Spirochaetota bacterium]